MITIGVIMSNAYADYSAHMIRGLCSRVKEKEGVNLIFFPGMLCSDLESKEESAQLPFYEDSIALVDVLIISDQEMLQMLLDQPEGALFSNVLEHVPYILLKDDTAQIADANSSMGCWNCCGITILFKNKGKILETELYLYR